MHLSIQALCIVTKHVTIFVYGRENFGNECHSYVAVTLFCVPGKRRLKVRPPTEQHVTSRKRTWLSSTCPWQETHACLVAHEQRSLPTHTLIHYKGILERAFSKKTLFERRFTWTYAWMIWAWCIRGKNKEITLKTKCSLLRTSYSNESETTTISIRRLNEYHNWPNGENWRKKKW
jgi:hypothetical protein